MSEPICPDGMMEVRCCCVPKKLLGWLPALTKGAPIFRFCTYPDYRIIELTVATIVMEDRTSHRAYKSDETPLEVLRTIRGWKENA